MSADSDAFDYVIVGAGAAGCLLANRLVAAASRTVCVLEAGPPDRSIFLRVPAGVYKASSQPKYAWQFETEPNPATANRSIPMPQGKTPAVTTRTLRSAPSVNGQAKAIAEALAVAGVEPKTIGYVEAHGTGTPLGDPIELTALNPKANLMRTEDDATAATAYLSGQADLFATNSLVVQELQKQNAGKEFDRKFVLARGPAHMGVRMGEQNLANWLNVFIYSAVMSGELDKLTQKWLGHPYEPLPAL